MLRRFVKNKWLSMCKKFEYLDYLNLRRDWKIMTSNKEEDYVFAKRFYKERMGTELNLENPQTFDEKLWYLKLNNKNPLLVTCSDKLKVRDYIKSLGEENILIELFGVYNDAEEINFDNIPSPSFFKCNHTSGYNKLFDRNKKFNRKDFIRRFNFILKQNYYYASREWNYKLIEPKIICEKVLKDSNGDLPLDYKFFCFNGKPEFLFYYRGTCSEDGTHSNSSERTLDVYDMNLIKLSLRGNFKNSNESLNINAEIFEEMKRIASKLSRPFPFCRVDLYNIEGKIYFGEITFYPAGGCNKFEPIEWQKIMGQMINIDNI